MKTNIVFSIIIISLSFAFSSCNKDNKDYEETENYWIRDGIVVVKKEAVIPNNSVI